MIFSNWWNNLADKTKDAKILVIEFEKYCDEEIKVPEINYKP